jgi:hypothetical protein
LSRLLVNKPPFAHFGHYSALSSLRTDDICALLLRSPMPRNPDVDWEADTDVLCSCGIKTNKNNRSVKSMRHALFVLPKAESGFRCTNAVYGIALGDPLRANSI